MRFDFRGVPGIEDAASDGQIYNSENVQPDEWYNCTWEGLRQTARAYGRGGYDDEQLRQIDNQISNRPGYSYGERWENSIEVAKQIWPDLSAVMAAEYPGDAAATLAAIKAYSVQNFRVHCGFWCDTNAWVPPQGPITYSHCLMNLWGDDAGVGWVNPEPHPDVFLTNDQFGQLYDGGGILVFKRSLIAAPVPLPFVEEDDMQIQLEPAGDLQGRDIISIGVAPNSDFGLTCYAGATVDVYANGTDGTPTGARRYTCGANQPGVKGPTEASDTAAALGIVAPGGVLTFVNRSPSRPIGWLHREG